VQQETLEKDVGVQRHGGNPVAVLPVAVGEAHPPIAHLDNPMVRDRDAMGVVAQIVHHLGWTGEGGLRIHDPPCGVELIAQSPEPRWRAQFGSHLRQA